MKKRSAAIARCALASVLAFSEAGGAFAGQLGAQAQGAAQLARDALSNPARVPRLDKALPVSLKASDAVIVPVRLEDFKADPAIDRAKIDAFLARAGAARGEKFVASPAKSHEVFDDWGLGYQFEPWTWEKPIPAQTRPEQAEDLVVRGRAGDPRRVERFMAAEYGRNRSRKILVALTRALEGLSPAQIKAMSAAQLHEAAARFFERIPVGIRAVSQPVRGWSREDDGDEPTRSNTYLLPSDAWRLALQKAHAGLTPEQRTRLFAGRPQLQARFVELPSPEKLEGAPRSTALVGPVAAALEEQGLTAGSFAALPSSRQAESLAAAFARVGGWVGSEADRAIAGSRRPVATAQQAEDSAADLLSRLVDPFLPQARREEVSAAYDELQTVLYARRLGALEGAVGRIAPALGLEARRYSGRLGGVLVSPQAESGPIAAPASNDERRFSDIVDRSLELFYSKSLGVKAATYLARWRLAKRFHEPAVSDPAGLYADAAVLGMTGEREAVGLRGYSHARVFEDSRALFRKYFGDLARDPMAVWNFERLLSAMYDELPDHFPIKFAQSMAAHLRRAALLPRAEVSDYLRDAAPLLRSRGAGDELQAKEQDKILSDFTAVVHQALAEQEAGPDRVVGVVLTGSFARLAARRDSDFDVQLITRDGGTQGLEPFMRRVHDLWRKTGHRNPIKPFPVALAPSLGLVQLVHKGPHVVIAADPSSLAAAPAAGRGAAVEEGIFDGEGDGSIRERVHAMAARAIATAGEDASKQTATTQVIGYFPGLSSWESYRGSGQDLWDSGLPEVREVYSRAAAALGLPGPQSLSFTAGNVPKDQASRAGFIAASFLAYNVALARLMERRSREGGAPVAFQAYAGDSLGVLTAAVASGSVSIEDGARIAQRLLVAINRKQHAPGSRPRRELELGYWNVTDAGMEGLLAQARKRFGRRFQNYRAIDWGRVKAYVDEDAFADFKAWLARRYPLAEVKDSGSVTRSGGYHTQDLSSVRGELARFLKESSIEIGAPSRPIVANNGSGLITTAEGVRKALLAMVDEPMDSKATAKTMEELKADAVVEVGLGDKGESLFRDNYLHTPTLSFNGQTTRLEKLQRIAARGPRWRKPD